MGKTAEISAVRQYLPNCLELLGAAALILIVSSEKGVVLQSKPGILPSIRFPGIWRWPIMLRALSWSVTKCWAGGRVSFMALDDQPCTAGGISEISVPWGSVTFPKDVVCLGVDDIRSKSMLNCCIKEVGVNRSVCVVLLWEDFCR